MLVNYFLKTSIRCLNAQLALCLKDSPMWKNYILGISTRIRTSPNIVLFFPKFRWRSTSTPPLLCNVLFPCKVSRLLSSPPSCSSIHPWGPGRDLYWIKHCEGLHCFVVSTLHNHQGYKLSKEEDWRKFLLNNIYPRPHPSYMSAM